MDIVFTITYDNAEDRKKIELDFAEGASPKYFSEAFEAIRSELDNLTVGKYAGKFDITEFELTIEHFEEINF